MPGGIAFGADAAGIEGLCRICQRMGVTKSLVNKANVLRFRFINNQTTVTDIITIRRTTAHPHTFGFGCGDFVADAVTGIFAFKLGKYQKHINHQAPDGGGGIVILVFLDRNEFNVIFFENVKQFEKIANFTG